MKCSFLVFPLFSYAIQANTFAKPIKIEMLGCFGFVNAVSRALQQFVNKTITVCPIRAGRNGTIAIERPLF
jgi:hypothetical protein